MNTFFRPFFLAVCVSAIFSAPILADESTPLSQPPVADPSTQNMVNGYLQIQAQLHDAQLAIQDTRREMAEDAKRNADALTMRIQTLEAALAEQRTSELQLAQKNQQFTLMMAGASGLIVVAAVLCLAYLQWRVVTRLMELSASPPREFSPGASLAASSFKSNAAIGQANARLFNAVDSLQQRILELEQSSRARLLEKIPAHTNGTHKISEIKNEPGHDERVANILAEGQLSLDAHDPEKALKLFDAALGLDPKNAEALIKKAGALEKLGRTDEAIACYDHAIKMNGALTIAHLHKGALFNRMARYDEALQCYEQALRTQEKKMTDAQMAA